MGCCCCSGRGSATIRQAPAEDGAPKFVVLAAQRMLMAKSWWWTACRHACPKRDRGGGRHRGRVAHVLDVVRAAHAAAPHVRAERHYCAQAESSWCADARAV